MIKLENYLPRPLPGKASLQGKLVRLEPIDWNKHGEQLAKCITGEHNADLWTYMPIGPFDNLDGLKALMQYVGEQLKWETMAITRLADDQVVGMVSFMRIRPEHGSAEIGCVVYSETLKKSIEATETMFLLATHLFDDLNYRRYEWKCDNNNTASKRAALRLGFKYEGMFRNDMVMKQRNRDTAWFAITDGDWPSIKAGFKTWLAIDNFTPDGTQYKALTDCREP